MTSATFAADMCPNCKGDNASGWALCANCANEALDKARAEVERLKARNDAAEEALDIEVNGRLEAEAEVERLTRELGEAREQLGELKPVWESRYSDETYTAKEDALVAAENDGYGHEGDDAVCWRLAGPWHDGTTEPPQHGQETAQEAAGDDPGGSVGNDARDGAGDAQTGADGAGDET